jgi:hypothetical protein
MCTGIPLQVACDRLRAQFREALRSLSNLELTFVTGNNTNDSEDRAIVRNIITCHTRGALRRVIREEIELDWRRRQTIGGPTFEILRHDLIRSARQNRRVIRENSTRRRTNL